MKLRALFFYVAFAVVASVIAVAMRDGGNESVISVLQPSQKKIAAQEALLEEDGSVAACMRDVRCPDCSVILLSVDSLRADHIGAYGYKRGTTPYFDELAKKGALFENYFSPSFLTPVSEMSVHTGMYPMAHKTTNFDTVLPEDITTLAQYFKQQGYATLALLSSPEFEINPALKTSFSRGFDRYEYVPDDLTVQNNNLRAFPHDDQSGAELDKLDTKKFFWWVAVGGVHWPYGEQGPNVFADDAYDGIFKDRHLEWWNAFQNIYEGVQYPDHRQLTKADIQYVIDQYDNGVIAFDDFLRQFMHKLARRNLLERTIVIIQSEHGEDLHEHGYFAHYDILDTQTHVPLLVLFPRAEKGCRIASFAGSADVFPTIVESLGRAPLGQFQGKSLLPIIHGSEKDGERQEVFLERSPLWEETFSIINALGQRGVTVRDEQHSDRGIRTPQWKYILRTSKQAMKKINWWQAITGKKMNFQPEELYDLAHDPGETKNVIDQHPNEAATLRQRLEIWAGTAIGASPKKADIEPTIQPYF